jgi:predicted TIM-barrel fold metal-dependent hydrolase
MTRLEIIDAQIHDPHPGREWEFGAESRMALEVELAREAMDCVGVDRALINAADAFIDAALSRYPDRFAGCVSANPTRPDLMDYVAAYRTRPGMLAMRISIRDWRSGTLTREYVSGSFEPLFEAAEKHDLPLFISGQGQPEAIGDIAQRHPGLTLIVDHIGLPQPPPMRVADDPWEQLPAVNALAQYPNVSIKFCGAHTLSEQPYPHLDVWPHLTSMLAAFGPERLMWASDFTRMRMAPGTIEQGAREGWATLYSDSVGFVRDTEQLSPSDKEKILSGTVRRILRWPE